MASDIAAQELLRDAFTRLIEHVDDLTDGLTEELADYRATPDANSIAWLLWHSARVQDAQVADIAGVRAGLDRARGGWTVSVWTCPAATRGYGHDAEEVGQGACAGRPAGRLLPGGACDDAGLRHLGDGRGAGANRGQAVDPAGHRQRPAGQRRSTTVRSTSGRRPMSGESQLTSENLTGVNPAATQRHKPWLRWAMTATRRCRVAGKS